MKIFTCICSVGSVQKINSRNRDVCHISIILLSLQQLCRRENYLMGEAHLTAHLPGSLNLPPEPTRGILPGFQFLSLDEEVRPQRPYRLRASGEVINEGIVHAEKSRHHLHPEILAKDRPTWSLVDISIRGHCHHQYVAHSLGGAEVAQVARVKKIKTTETENDPLVSVRLSESFQNFRIIFFCENLIIS